MGNKFARKKDEVSHGRHVKQTSSTTTTKTTTTLHHQKRSYSDLPMDILTSIAGQLTVTDLLNFGSTCKDFRSAAANIEISETDYWLLYHETKSSSRSIFSNKTKSSSGSEYILYDLLEQKTYSINIPDLEGAYCLGSNQGWLLVSKDELLFFISPFTLNKIALPDFPHKNIYGHVAAFSDVPTSPHCVISIFNPVPEQELTEVNVISKGETAWTQHKVWTPNLCRVRCRAISGAKFDHKTQTFYFIDREIHYYVLKVSLKDEQWIPYIFYLNHVSDRCVSSSESVHIIFRDKRGGSKRFEEDHVDTSSVSFKINDRYHHLHSRPAVDLTPPKTGIRMAITIQPRVILPTRRRRPSFEDDDDLFHF